MQNIDVNSLLIRRIYADSLARQKSKECSGYPLFSSAAAINFHSAQTLQTNVRQTGAGGPKMF
jgi:hypothetical protein